MYNAVSREAAAGLAVMFRSNDPNLGHVSTLEAMHSLGLAYPYGVYRGTPRAYRKLAAQRRGEIAQQLEKLAM